jgi:hypothetical protein
MGEGNEQLVCEKCGAPKPVKQFSTFAAGSAGVGLAAAAPASGSGFT